MAKILVADDEPEVLQFCAAALKNEKHTLVFAETGPMTMEKLLTENPDLLVLDIMLPGIDGYSLQLRMEQDEKLSDIPVIIITALKPAQGLFEKFKQIKAFLAKPFSQTELQNAVQDALVNKRSGNG